MNASNITFRRPYDYNQSNYFSYLLLFLFTLIFLAVCSFATSPLSGGYAADSATFIMLGKMLLAGKTPYIDYFDHKGPMVIFIEAFGQLLSSNDRLGVFILQVISLTIAEIFIYKTARFFVSRINSLTIALVCLVFLRFTIEGGNLTEEYSLPFTSVSIWLTVRYYITGTNRVTPVHLFILGLCSAVLFWSRLNNMGITVACSLFIFICYALNKDRKGIIQLILWLALGFLFVSIPIIIYFISVDALSEMIDAAFLFNFRYIGTGSDESPFGSPVSAFFYILKGWTPFIALIAGTSAIYYISRDKKIMLLSVLLLFIGYITTHIGAAYYHYMTLNMPILALGMAYCLYSITCNTSRKKLSACLLIAIFTPLAVISANKIKDSSPDSDLYYRTQAEDAAKQIPDNELNSVYAYQVMARFYPSSGLLPCYKYFTMQEWHGKYNPAVLDSINLMMEKQPPLWVVSQFRDMSNNERFYEIVNQKYHLHYKNDLFEVFRLNNKK